MTLLEQARQRIRSTLRRSTEQKAYMRDCSHALHASVMIIEGNAQAIEKGVLPPEEASRTIIQQCERMLPLLEEALQYAQTHKLLYLGSESGTVLSLNKETKACVERFSFMKNEKSVSFHPTTPGQDRLLGSSRLLEIILDNLLTNAIRYAEHRVEVSVDSDGEYLSVTVADDGSGIREEDLPYLFDRYYKGEKGRHGLGLTISSQVARHMNGTLSAANRPEGGAAFTLRLQQAKEGSAKQE